MQSCMVCYNPLTLYPSLALYSSSFRLISSTGQLTKATLKLDLTSNTNTDT